MKNVIVWAIGLTLIVGVWYLFFKAEKPKEAPTLMSKSKKKEVLTDEDLIKTDSVSAKRFFSNYKKSLDDSRPNPPRVCNYPHKLWLVSTKKEEFEGYFKISLSVLIRLAPPPTNDTGIGIHTGVRVYLSIDDSGKENNILVYTIKKGDVELYDSAEHYYILNKKVDWCHVIKYHDHLMKLGQNKVPPLTSHLCDPTCPPAGALLKDF